MKREVNLLTPFKPEVHQLTSFETRSVLAGFPLIKTYLSSFRGLDQNPQAHAEQCYAEGVPSDAVQREQGDWIGWFQQGENGVDSIPGQVLERFFYHEIYQVFCSQWLSHKQVIFGTKCNKLMVVDVNTRHMDQIPSLQSSENSVPPDQECGIHSIEINPSRTLLATGARNSNDVAVYRQVL